MGRFSVHTPLSKHRAGQGGVEMVKIAQLGGFVRKNCAKLLKSGVWREAKGRFLRGISTRFAWFSRMKGGLKLPPSRRRFRLRRRLRRTRRRASQAQGNLQGPMSKLQRSSKLQNLRDIESGAEARAVQTLARGRKSRF